MRQERVLYRLFSEIANEEEGVISNIQYSITNSQYSIRESFTKFEAGGFDGRYKYEY